MSTKGGDNSGSLCVFRVLCGEESLFLYLDRIYKIDRIYFEDGFDALVLVYYTEFLDTDMDGKPRRAQRARREETKKR